MGKHVKGCLVAAKMLVELAIRLGDLTQTTLSIYALALLVQQVHFPH
jgi:hypothetical protein